MGGSEGLGSLVGLVGKSRGWLLQGDTQNDTWLFVLAILLSSTLIYNSRGTIDQPAMEQLQYPWGQRSAGALLLWRGGGRGPAEAQVVQELPTVLVVPGDGL